MTRHNTTFFSDFIFENISDETLHSMSLFSAVRPSLDINLVRGESPDRHSDRLFVYKLYFTTKNICARAGATKNGLNAPHDVFVSVFHVCLTILKHFAKIFVNFYKKFTKLDFGQIFLKISKISTNLENIFEKFPLKTILKIENFEIPKFLIFRFSIRFSMDFF